MKSNTIIRCGVLLMLAMVLVTCIAPPKSPARGTPQSTRPSNSIVTPQPTRLPNSISISIVTNNTQAEWLGKVTDDFNASRAKTTAGHQIVVEIVPEDSPEPTVRKIVAGELQPTLWSPSDLSWVEQVRSQSPVAN